MDFIYSKLLKSNEYSEGPLKPSESTILAALTEMRTLHLQIHFERETSSMVYDRLYALSSFVGHIIAPCALQAPRWGGERRKVIVHLDHCFPEYRKKFPRFSYRHNPRSIHNIVVQMGKAKNIDWTLRYYVSTGLDPKFVPSIRYRDGCLADLKYLDEKCQPYGNIEVRPEMWGTGRWEELEWPEHWQRLITTSITSPNKGLPEYRRFHVGRVYGFGASIRDREHTGFTWPSLIVHQSGSM
jgi:hypothetical protein